MTCKAYPKYDHHGTAHAFVELLTQLVAITADRPSDQLQVNV